MAMEDIPPAMLNPAPVTTAWEMLTLTVPVLVKVKFWELLEPSVTLPKLKFVALAASAPDGEFPLGEPAAVRPTQPESDRTATTARHKARSGKDLLRFSVRRW